MTDTLPPPMTPPDADLRDFRFYPLDVVRFTQSGLATLEDPAAVIAAIKLWGAAWHNVPAGSLDDNDRQLAQLAGYGVVVDAFRAIKDGALRGWVKCSDGRLYHPVVAEKVEEAWRGKLKQRWRTYCNAIRQHNSRNDHDQRDAPAFEDWLEHGRPTTVVRGRKPPQQTALPLDPDDGSDDSRAHPRDPARAPARVSGEGANVTRDNGDMSRATKADVARDSGGESRSSHTENGSKGQGQGQGQGDSTSSTPREGEDLISLTNRLAKIGGVSIINPRRISMAMDTVKTWLADGIDVDGIIVPTIEKRVASMRAGDTVGSLGYFDPDIRKVLALKGKGNGGGKDATAFVPIPIADRDDVDDRLIRIRGALRERCGERTYESWLGPTVTAFHVQGRELIVRTSSLFLADWIHSNMADRLSKAAKAEGLERVQIGTL